MGSQMILIVCISLVISTIITREVLSQKSPPNIIIVLADDLGYGNLSIRGASDMQTPHLDQLAQGGLRITQFYANSTVCSPSRAALLSGKYPDLIGVPGVIRQNPGNSWGYLAKEVVLLPQLLTRAGYCTAHIGK